MYIPEELLEMIKYFANGTLWWAALSAFTSLSWQSTARS